MPIPKTRADLIHLIETSARKLHVDLKKVDAKTADEICTDDWSIKDLLAVRSWWTWTVIDYVLAGQQGHHPDTPAPGYTWRETPRLNSDIVVKSQKESFATIVARLEEGQQRVLGCIDSLTDSELLEVGAFAWADKWPIARWISINTSTQYASARTMIRRVLRDRDLL